ncbi:MAG: leucine-rich repeat domain-containing protein [Methanomassiliicoccaceae archaeon]|nr:leucine-rich repeat domain-containing protein [Methanomassiliicoccaceae archaeon]
MTKSKDRSKAGSCVAVAVLAAAMLIAGSFFFTAQSADDSYDGTLGASDPYILTLDDMVTFVRTGESIDIQQISEEAMEMIVDDHAGMLTLIGMEDEIGTPLYVVTIGINAFLYGAGLTSIELGSGVMNIAEGAFVPCTSLTEILVNEDPEASAAGPFASMDGVLYMTEGGQPTVLFAHPAAREMMGAHAGKAYELPSSIRRVASFAFAGTDVAQIDLPITGSPLDVGGVGSPITFDENALGGQSVLFFHGSANSFMGWYYNNGTEADPVWVYASMSHPAFGDTAAFTIYPKWLEGQTVVFKFVLDGVLKNEASTVMIVGGEFKVIAGYYLALGSNPEFFNDKRIITMWLCDFDDETYLPGDMFTMPGESVTFTAVWSVHPGGDEGKDQGGLFDLEGGAFMWLLLLLVILLLSILFAYMISRRRNQEE